MKTKTKRLIITTITTLFICGVIIGSGILYIQHIVEQKARRAKQIGQYKQLSLAIQMYKEDNEKLPKHSDFFSKIDFQNFYEKEEIILKYNSEIDIDNTINNQILSSDGITIYNDGSVLDNKK